jgi:hypothetical protein
VVLGPVTIPKETRFFSGTLGLLDILFASLTAWYAHRARELSRLCGIPFRKTATGWSTAILFVGVGIFGFLVLASIMLTIADTRDLMLFILKTHSFIRAATQTGNNIERARK